MALKNKKQILVVDDVTTNLKCLGEILRDKYALSMAKSGEQAISMAERIHPDLVLLDIKMPGMDGYETLEKLKSIPSCKDIPVIFLTADKENESEIKGFKLGASDFIRKPYEPEIMITRIERVIEQEDKNRQIAMLALKDSLTGVWNRRYLNDEIEKSIAMKETGSLLILDLDNFKGINDKYGHVVGDAAIIAFAETLQRFVHKDDIVSRIGGDEFAIYLRNAYGEELLAQRIGSLIKEVEEELRIIKEDKAVSSVSIGISALPFDGKSFIELYNNADKALYYVKRNGKSGFHFYNIKEKYNYIDESDIVIDIADIKKLIGADEEEGPYKVNYTGFKDIYSMLRRYAVRKNSDIQVALFTLKDLDIISGNNNISLALKKLEKAIKMSLRKSDVCTEFTKTQYLVLLMDVDATKRQPVIERIVDCFNELNDNENVLLKYDVETIVSEGEANVDF